MCFKIDFYVYIAGQLNEGYDNISFAKLLEKIVLWLYHIPYFTNNI